MVDSRKAKGLTQIDISLSSGIRIDIFQQIENLKIVPTTYQMCEIASILEKQIDYLFPVELLLSIKAGVFSRRTVELNAPEIISLTEAQRLNLTYDSEAELIDKVDKLLLVEKVKETLSKLTPREERVLELRFGLNGGVSHTLEEVGREFGVTREMIRQVESKALRKLRHPSRSRKLKDYWD